MGDMFLVGAGTVGGTKFPIQWFLKIHYFMNSLRISCMRVVYFDKIHLHTSPQLLTHAPPLSTLSTNFSHMHPCYPPSPQLLPCAPPLSTPLLTSLPLFFFNNQPIPTITTCAFYILMNMGPYTGARSAYQGPHP